MAGEDLLEDDTGTGSKTGPDGKKGKKPLSKGQKIGLGIGLVTIVLFIYQIEKGKAASSSTAASSTAPIDPTTGYPSGSAQDESALAGSGTGGAGGFSSGGGGGFFSDPSSSAAPATDPFQGVDPSSGQTYASELSTLGSDYSGLQSQYTTLQQAFTTWSSTGTTTPPTTTTSPVTKAPTSAQAANLAKLNQELGKDQAAKKPNKTAIATLKKQIAAVNKRS
jgi:hypothetical protein